MTTNSPSLHGIDAWFVIGLTGFAVGGLAVAPSDGPISPTTCAQGGGQASQHPPETTTPGVCQGSKYNGQTITYAPAPTPTTSSQPRPGGRQSGTGTNTGGG